MFHTCYIDLYVCRENRSCGTVVTPRRLLGKCVIHIAENVEMTGGISVVKEVKYKRELERCIWRYYFSVNLLKPTGHVMHNQFNIQQLYALPTLYLCVLHLSEKKQRLVPLTA